MDIKAILDQQGGLNKGANTPRAFYKLLARAMHLENNGHLYVLLELVLKTNNKSTLHHVFTPRLDIKGLHVLATMLWKFQSNHLMTPILYKGLLVLQHLTKHGVVEGRSLTLCTHHFCMHKICKSLLYDLTKHKDDQVRALATTFQKLKFQMPQKPHSTHVAFCEGPARKKAQRKKVKQEKQGSEDNKILVKQEVQDLDESKILVKQEVQDLDESKILVKQEVQDLDESKILVKQEVQDLEESKF